MNYNSLKSDIASVVRENGNQEITGENLQGVLTEMIDNSVGTGYLYKGIATPETQGGTPDQNVFYLAGAGTYGNFGGTIIPKGFIGIFSYNGVWSYNILEISESDIFDISEYNNTSYANLSAALNGNIPVNVRKGGMSVKFVQTSDNKYVQARCMAQNFTTDVKQWQGVDDEPTTGSENLVKSGGVKNVLTIHLTYILYQDGTPTAPGQYYIYRGELRYCTYFNTAVNYGYTVIPFNPDILYEFKGFYFKWNGTSLVMLETSFSENLLSVAEVDNVKDANALDIHDLISATRTKLNTDGSLSGNSNSIATVYHIPVNHKMRIRCRVYNTIVVGYKSIDDDSPVVLFNAPASSSNIATYDVRIPEGIKYIRMGSALTTPIYLIDDSLYLQETIDVDAAYPLNNGFYTVSTAIAAIRGGNRTLDKKIIFSKDNNNRETWKFNGSTVADWDNLYCWKKENDEDLSVKGITADTNFGINLNSAIGTVDLTRDQFIEFVCTTKNRPSTGTQYYFASSKIFNLRYNAGSLQAYFRNKIYALVSPSDKNEYHHFMMIKSRIEENGVTTHYYDVYVDGVRAVHEDVTEFISNNIPAPSQSYNFFPWYDFLMLRAGYYTGDSDSVAAFAAKHFNDNKPTDYKDIESTLFCEILSENMHVNYLVNSANGLRTILDTSTQPISLLYNSPYDEVLKGSGAPTKVAKYKGQKYIDVDTYDEYTAHNTQLVGDWKKNATINDVNSLKTQTKTVNGQSIWGSGDIEGGGSGSGSGNVINVLNYGAVGDGVTDDTNAIMQATEAARTSGKALYFPNGTYLTRKSIVLTSGMKVTGEPNAILQSASATLEGGGKCIFTTLTANAAVGATQITVSNTTGFVVGQEIVIWKSGSYTETMADITAVNGNTITISTERFTADGTNGGILNAVASGGYVLTDFAMIKTIMTKTAVNVVVENITIKAMSDMAEPHIYPSSPISQTRQNGNVEQKNFRVYNVTIYDSANDGISIQGSGESEVIGCRVYNQKHKGIHWGTNHDMIRIMNNYVYGCGSAQYENPSDYQGSGGMFFCSSCHRTIITGNHIENCYKGIFGFNYQSNGECDSNTIIANNTFKNCTLYGVILRDGIHAVLEANNFLGFGGTSIPIYVDNPNGQHLRNAVIANNTIGEWAAASLNSDNEYNPAIKINSADGIVISGNVISIKKTTPAFPTVDASRCNVVVISSNNVVITSNITEGNIDTSDSGNTGIVKANNIEVL